MVMMIKINKPDRLASLVNFKNKHVASDMRTAAAFKDIPEFFVVMGIFQDLLYFFNKAPV